ncbi:hypothetical protein niasHS_018170 [Heterodera schachtii]|uniref:Uncharacterized protein n=1 Tax=Heterodera schachtii TaxID=97005 RepID=A0ABD2HX28_HETSC
MMEKELFNQSKDIAIAEVTTQTLRKFFFKSSKKEFSVDDYAALIALKEKLIITTTEEEKQNAKVENAQEKGQNAKEKKGQNAKEKKGHSDKENKGQSAKIENAKEKKRQSAKVENAKNELQQQLIADIEHVEKIWHRSNVKIEDPTIEHSVNSEQALVLVDANLGGTTECEQLLEEFGESANRALKNAKAEKLVQTFLDRINVQEMVDKLGNNDEESWKKQLSPIGDQMSIIGQLMGYLSQLQTVDGIPSNAGIKCISKQVFNRMAQHLGIEWHQVKTYNGVSNWRLAMRGFSALNVFLKGHNKRGGGAVSAEADDTRTETLEKKKRKQKAQQPQQHTETEQCRKKRPSSATTTVALLAERGAG